MAPTKLYGLQIEYQDTPLGLDIERPRFSWKMASKRPGASQTAWQLKVLRLPDNEEVWNTGRVEGDQSNEIFYDGAPLLACTRYDVFLTVWDELHQECQGKTWFETGLMDPSIRAWEGAEFIGPLRYSMCASLRGIFALETRLRFEPGSFRGGLVFGAGDERLMDARMNEYGIEGRNFIRYELDVRTIPAMLLIYRAGYAKEDREDVPFARVPVIDLAANTPVITEENRWEPHILKIEVTGNCAYAYVDGVLVDAVDSQLEGVKFQGPRQLNPRGFNDCITYPRLNEIGFFAGKGDTVFFEKLVVRNLRTPCAAVVEETPNGGLYGERGIFEAAFESGELSVKNGWFCVKAADRASRQLTARPSPVSCPMLRTVFEAYEGKRIKNARLYATARGIYDCKMNGAPVTDHYFAPGCSQYDKHLMYQTYDITHLVKEGKNGVGVTLASGWWSDAQTYALQNYNYYGDKEAFLAKIVVNYDDGSRQVIVTEPENWRYYGKGPYTYAGLFHGEHLDGQRLALYEEYSLPSFDDSSWEKPEVIHTVPIKGIEATPLPWANNWPDLNGQEPELVGSYQAPVKEYCRVKAVAVTEPRKGLYLYDFGQEMAGVPELVFCESPGTVVTMRYGEMLYPSLEEYGDMCGMLLLENYRDASSTDIYRCKGSGYGETYRPKLTFHGYRYIEISGISKPLPLEAVTSIQLSSIGEMTGRFECSNALVNRFVENVKWSQLCNFISIPTDCPQRNERMGWAGDTHVFCNTAIKNSDLRLFYYRVLEAFRDLQKDGKFPEIAPAGGGFGGITYESAPIYMTWELYVHYADKRIVEMTYPALKAFMDYIRRMGMPGLSFVGPLGDWLAVDETDKHLLWNAFYCRDCFLMEKLARLAGEENDARLFSALGKEAARYWQSTFLEPGTGRTVNAEGKLVDTQCSYVLPICYGILTGEMRSTAGEHLARKVLEDNGCIRTGFFGTGLINEALTITGHGDLAAALMEQTKYPSWLYPVTQGATTIWERWDSFTMEKGFGGNNEMNSFNHYSLGSVVSWLYSYVLGIQAREDAPGFKRFLLKPYVYGFEWAKGGLETPYGRIESGWRKSGGKIHFRFFVPANTRATLILPGEGNTSVELEPGEHIFESAIF